MTTKGTAMTHPRDTVTVAPDATFKGGWRVTLTHVTEIRTNWAADSRGAAEHRAERLRERLHQQAEHAADGTA